MQGHVCVTPSVTWMPLFRKWNDFDLFQDRAGGRCESVTDMRTGLFSEISVLTGLGASGRKVKEASILPCVQFVKFAL